MIEKVLPACVSAVETWQDVDVTLFPEEEAAVERAVESRRREFASGRDCARRALAALGIAPQAIGTGAQGEPVWPLGVVGSITHCDGYRASAVARARDVAILAIDAEPHAALPAGLLPDIARAEELPELRRLRMARPELHWDRLLFSAKESVYKAWFPLAKRWLGFEDASVEFDLGTESFVASLLVPGPTIRDRTLGSFSGRWMVSGGIITTAITVESQ
jgi:4'-phosphopantetheinyl transferase EntD